MQNNDKKITIKKPFVLWFTGFSGSGKSTLAITVENKLIESGINNKNIIIFDSDIVRQLCREIYKDHLGFSKKDRDINVRRLGNIAKIAQKVIPITIVTAISPYIETRQEIRQLFKNFIEIYVKCSIQECKKRDVKGLYKQVKQGKLKHFTGIDDPYEEPLKPEIIVNTEFETIEKSTNKIFLYLLDNNFIIY